MQPTFSTSEDGREVCESDAGRRWRCAACCCWFDQGEDCAICGAKALVKKAPGTKLRSLAVGLVAAVWLILLAPLITAARADTREACYDELVLRWNQFASDANLHINTTDVRPEKHEKVHEKLRREWEQLQTLRCW
jgi:hypothetical protein